MTDWIIVHDLNVPSHVELDTKLLAPDGRRIVRLPEQVGFHKTQQRYGLKND